MVLVQVPLFWQGRVVLQTSTRGHYINIYQRQTKTVSGSIIAVDVSKMLVLGTPVVLNSSSYVSTDT